MVSYWWIVNGCWRRNLLITTIRCCFGHFGHQHPLSFYISFGHQHSKDVTKIHKSSPTISRQHHCSRLDANDHFAQTSSTSCLRGIKPLYDMNLMPMVNNKLKKKLKMRFKTCGSGDLEERIFEIIIRNDINWLWRISIREASSDTPL